MLPVLVVGAGPAGVSCATQLASWRCPVVLADQQNDVGGMLKQYGHHKFDLIAPERKGADTVFFLRHLVQRYVGRGTIRLDLNRRIESLRADNGTFDLGGGDRFSAVVLATGTTPRGIEHHDPDNGVIVGAGRVLESRDARGLRVAVLGGGDNAFENAARILKEGAQSVVIYSRSKPRAMTLWQERAKELGVDVVCGPYRLHARHVESSRGMRAYDLVAVLWGYEQNTSLFQSMNKGGDTPPMLLIGDAARPDQQRSIASALSDGTLAARDLARTLHL